MSSNPCVNSDPNFGNFIAPPSPSLLPRPSSPIPYAGSPYSIPNFDEEQVVDHLLETQVENDMNFRPSSVLQAAHTVLFEKLDQNMQQLPPSLPLVHFAEDMNSNDDINSSFLVNVATIAKCLIW